MMRSRCRPQRRRSIAREAADGREIVRLLAEPVAVEILDRRVLHRGRLEALQRDAARLRDARGLILEPRLVRRDLACLRRAFVARDALDRLPAHPRELVVVPHRHEGPARTRVLQIRVLQIGAVERAVVGERRGDAEPADLLAVGIAHAIAQPPVVAVPARPVLRVVDHLVDEIAEMQHERELFFGRRALVLEDHPAIGVLRAFTDVLAADEREAHGAWIVRRVPCACARCGCLRRVRWRSGTSRSVQAAGRRPARDTYGRPLRAHECVPSLRRARMPDPRPPRRSAAPPRPCRPQSNASRAGRCQWLGRRKRRPRRRDLAVLSTRGSMARSSRPPSPSSRLTLRQRR